ncbi:hypothetical protein [Curtobacterium sp. MCBD17_040]|uniref:hypothetical protein n=1 Tax=Curtobacterium sp. MCBD17_040 TaxID=2175674 RepID=UPI000DA78B61|nr:hypothetical protein [Curtobacterium sp. MCBD17_040]WIB65411.1 hypothetical protein DEI94_18565 [Curtobacterium sp. MCBD17_040]
MLNVILNTLFIIGVAGVAAQFVARPVFLAARLARTDAGFVLVRQLSVMLSGLGKAAIVVGVAAMVVSFFVL